MLMGDEDPKKVTQKLAPQSFIIKFIFEQVSDKASPVEWRGQIKHVPSGESKYFRTLDGITKFIMPYLERIGVQLDKPGWLTRWWRR